MDNYQEETRKNKAVEWVRSHGKLLAGIAMGVAAGIAMIFGACYLANLDEESQELDDPDDSFVPEAALADSQPEEVFSQSIIDVSEHLRNLHEGWKASEDKIATAAENGFELEPGQTWVGAYQKGGTAA